MEEQQSLTNVNPIKLILDGETFKYQDFVEESAARNIVAWLQTGRLTGLSLPTSAPNTEKVIPVDVFLGAQEYLPSSPAEKPKGLVVSLQESGASSNPEKIVAFGKFLEDNDGLDSFSSRDIDALFEKARVGRPKNLSRDIGTAVQLGYISESSEKGKYFLTQSGMDALQSQFSQKPKLSGPRKTKAAGSRQQFPPVRQEIETLEISTSHDGIVDYDFDWKRSKKILWCFAYANLFGFNSLSPKEVESISRRLRDTIDTRAFTSANQPNMKGGYLKLLTGGSFEIQQKGLTFLNDVGA